MPDRYGKLENVPMDIDATEHYRQQYKRKQRELALAIGFIGGLVAGLLWEAIRR